MSKKYSLTMRFKLSETMTLTKLRVMEQSLFWRAIPVAWVCSDLVLLHGHSRGGGGVIYAGAFENMPVIVKFPPTKAIKEHCQNFFKEIEQEYQQGLMLQQVSGVPRYADKKELLVKTKSNTIIKVPFIIVEQVNGVPFNSLIHRNLDVNTKSTIFIRLVEILGKVHKAGVVHKDINPGNILIEYNSRRDLIKAVWLVDFGASLQQRRFVAQYGSPEQHIPLGYGDVGVHSDMFSLGLVMYFLFEEKLPFHENIAARAIAEEKEFSLDFQLCGNQGIQAILTKMLRKEPMERYSSMDEIYQDVTEVTNQSIRGTCKHVC